MPGIVEMVRYADDFIICVQHQDEAKRILEVLRKRLGKFDLELAEDKTRILEFGVKPERTRTRGEKPETFNFLGFTHFVALSRKGFFMLGRKTDRKKLVKAPGDETVAFECAIIPC